MADINDVKIILRSILTSFPGIPTMSQVLEDFEKLEGYPLPYKKLGFNTVYELFKTMNDVIKMPCFPNMDSPLKLILDEKSIHIRDLVVNQKIKKTRKNAFKKSSNHADSKHFNKYSSNTYPSYTNSYNTSCNYNNNYNARGYNYVKTKSRNPFKPKGKVTEDLQSHVEHLCNSSKSKSISINKFKACLITHPDYEKLGTSNLEVAINMLKYFIYIDKGGVHLKESYSQIFSSEKPEVRNIPKSKGYTPCIIDDEEELSNFDMDYYDFGLAEDFILNTEELNESNLNNLQLKNSNTIINQEQKADMVKTVSVLKNEPLNNNVKLKTESKVKDETSPNIQKKSEIDYKNAIVSIISLNQMPITVKGVMDSFKYEYGYSFPFEKFACRSLMDFFRLHPALFKLDNQYSTSSFVTLHKTPTANKTIIHRKNFLKSSILYDQTYLENWNSTFSPNVNIVKSNDSSLLSKNNNHQKPKESIENCTESADLFYKMYDSEMVKESMKNKMRNILMKYKNGILCDNFMDIYAKEYNSQYTFYEYGFKSMKDMAYKLPSVFYVKVTDEDECILFHACRRNEHETNNLTDSSQFYKNIPKTILHNLSLFFDQHRYGIKFDDLQKLYCV